MAGYCYEEKAHVNIILGSDNSENYFLSFRVLCSYNVNICYIVMKSFKTMFASVESFLVREAQNC